MKRHTPPMRNAARRAVLALGLILACAAGSASAQDALQRSADLSAQLDSAARSAAAGAAQVQDRLTREQAATAHAIGVSLANDPNVAAVAEQWQGLVTSGGFGTTDVDALVFAIMLEAIQQTNADKRAFLERLNSAGDDAQLANVDMQNILQKQQQLLRMLSNISKQLHDTAMAVVRKIGE